MFGYLLVGALSAGTALASQDAPALGSAPVYQLEASDHDNTRTISVDLSPLSEIGRVENVSYDPELAVRALTPTELSQQPDWVIAVRLVLGEVGPDRLVSNRWGLLEAIAILETVSNRLDRDTWDPDGIGNLRPWPGCGDDGTFASCANPRQYFALRQPRALAPRRTVRDTAMLQAAVDLAIEAWWLHVTGAVDSVSGGATSFVHRCGGEAYGARTIFCDGRPHTADLPGAEPNTGPLVLKGPDAFLRRRGRYALDVTRIIDHAPSTSNTRDDLVTYLWGAPEWSAEDFTNDVHDLDALWDSPLEDDAIDTAAPAP